MIISGFSLYITVISALVVLSSVVSEFIPHQFQYPAEKNKYDSQVTYQKACGKLICIGNNVTATKVQEPETFFVVFNSNVQ